GAAAPRKDRLAGIITGNDATDYRNVSVLLEAFAALATRTDVREVCVAAVDKAIEATGAERGALMLADDQGALSTVVARGPERGCGSSAESGEPRADRGRREAPGLRDRPRPLARGRPRRRVGLLPHGLLPPARPRPRVVLHRRGDVRVAARDRALRLPDR